jgi:hypothetical protein
LNFRGEEQLDLLMAIAMIIAGRKVENSRLSEETITKITNFIKTLKPSAYSSSDSEVTC